MIRILDETGEQSTIEIVLVADIVSVIFSPDFFKKVGLTLVEDKTVVQMETVSQNIVGGKKKKGGKEEKEKEKDDDVNQEVTYPYKYFYNAFEAFNKGKGFSLTSLFKKTKKEEEKEEEAKPFSLFDKKEEKAVDVDVPVTTNAGPGIFSTPVTIAPVKEENAVAIQDTAVPEKTALQKMQEALMGPEKEVEEGEKKGEKKEEGEEKEKSYLDKIKDAFLGTKKMGEEDEVTKEGTKEEDDQNAVAKEGEEEGTKEEAKDDQNAVAKKEEKKGFFERLMEPAPAEPKGKTAQVKLQIYGNVLKKKDFDKKKEECKTDPNNIEASPIDGKTRQETNADIRNTEIQWEHKDQFLNALSAEEKYKISQAYDALPMDDDANAQIFYVYSSKDDKIATILDFRLFRKE